ncbi:MAG: helix-turn-helix transcriptional regulator [Dehalococcoidia bacterium]|nr:helix-turn-helix transcriptional regulator [Dehalococcoidia bacterium]MYI86006.1 helix-turn-helix transcriptional regulator [Dehalococcoidia bacterium]
MRTSSYSEQHPPAAHGLQIGGRPVPYETGELPEDFPQRLCRLRERSGLTWTDFAEAVGADPKQVLRWRHGAHPCGGSLHSLLRVAGRIPGGVQLIMGDDFELTGRED